MENEFKPGDLVFEIRGGHILLGTLKDYGGILKLEGGYIAYTSSGCEFGDLYAGRLFHATPENRQALVTLYGEDAVPEIPLRGSELTRKLLEKQKYAMCYCCDTSDDDCRKNKNIRIITCFKGGYFYSGKVDSPFVATWKYAVPIDMNGNEITEIEE